MHGNSSTRHSGAWSKACCLIPVWIHGHLSRQRAAPWLHQADLLAQLATAQEQQEATEEATEEIRVSLARSQQRSRFEAAKAKALVYIRLQRAKQSGKKEEARELLSPSRPPPLEGFREEPMRMASKVVVMAGKANSLTGLPSGVVSLICRQLRFPYLGLLRQSCHEMDG